MNFYTGVGSRQTPDDILDHMFKVAYLLAKNSWVLRSGAADGADTAFEDGCDRAEGPKAIYLPWGGFNGRFEHEEPFLHVGNKLETYQQAVSIASKFHPYWGGLSSGAKNLHTRNVFQVLGHRLDSPSKFLLCWTPGGKQQGGTAQAIRIAEHHNVPVINMFHKDWLAEVNTIISKE